jgi:hypothetical protein
MQERLGFFVLVSSVIVSLIPGWAIPKMVLSEPPVGNWSFQEMECIVLHLNMRSVVDEDGVIRTDAYDNSTVCRPNESSRMSSHWFSLAIFTTTRTFT